MNARAVSAEPALVTVAAVVVASAALATDLRLEEGKGRDSFSSSYLIDCRNEKGGVENEEEFWFAMARYE